ncbi:hypothetical protein VTI74DRAFT_4952 [Chaetomium olivicolor]
MVSSRSPSPSPRESTPAATRPTTQDPFAALSDSSSEADDEILRPRGKIASRMQVRGNEQQEPDSEHDDDATSTRSSPPRKNRDNAASQDENDEDDDDVVTTRPRKLKSRQEHSSTPESTPRAPPASPGLFVSPRKDVPSSPGLFVSPSKPQSPPRDNADSDDDKTALPDLTKNPRFQALVAKKRAERLAREAEEARKKAERRKAAGYGTEDDIDDEEDSITDDEDGRKLTQEVAKARAPRKASKKALEEMSRETQRLTRSLQLAHEAKVKKKITKATLFERFNFKPEGAEEKTAPAAESSSRAQTPVSAQQSDAEMKDAETPPSSPPQVGKGETAEKAAPPAAVESLVADNEDDFPTLEETVDAAARKKTFDKGKGKATAADLSSQPAPRKRNIRVRLPQPTALPVSLDDDEDNDLQIQPTRTAKLDAIFNRIPANQAKQPGALQLLRRLAHLDDPDKKPAPPSRAGNKPQNRRDAPPPMTAGELQASLLQRARQQAKLERDRHLEMLRAKGIHVQTAEERERELQEVEDIVAKARREAEEIMQREREAAKAERKRRKGQGEEDLLGWDESEDEEYVEEEEGEPEEREIELSGSEEEEEEEEGQEEEEEGEEGKMVDDAAEESATEEAEEKADEDEDEELHLPSSNQARRRPRKHVTILSDDEDDAAPLVKATPRPKAQFAKSPSAHNAESPSVPTSVLRSATKTFIPGLPVAGPAGLGLTQIFAGTMDDSQVGTAPISSPTQPRPTFDVTAFPDSNFSQTAQEAAEDMIRDSQPNHETQQPETQGVQIRFSQSQFHGFDTFLQQETQNPTQMSELIEPTQDAGFHNFSPLRQRFVEAPASTVDTVPASHGQAEAEANDSPLVRRTGKLRRRADVVPASPTRHAAADEEDEPMEDLETDEFGFGTVSNNAFVAMKEAALKEKKRKEAFDKKKSKAREMVEEQAEESEDEYAGLGGADGEDSDDDDDDHSVKEMIDDETKENQDDERKLAAFYADRERASDEKQVEKLFHDITTGMLRRKRGGNWDDLSDSDDGGEARRRMKRRQFAKMQRALFADERISKVAENPRNQAFLRTIEDRGSDDDMDFILAPPPPPSGADSQDSQASAAGKATVIPNSQPQAATVPSYINPRRTKGEGKKPSNLSEVRESLSNLLDEPSLNFGSSSSLIPATEPALSSDEEEAHPSPSDSGQSTSSNKENHPRRTIAKPTSIVDRIAVKRNASITSTSSKLAFSTTTAGTANSTFKVPALLRRATTNSLLSTSSSTSSGTTTPTGVTTHNGTTTSSSFGKTDDSMKIKKTAGKRSGVSYLARETERRAAVAEAERRREARKWKGVEGRVKAVGGLFGGGKFE